MNPAPNLPLNINPSSPIPISVQLKEQLLCLIGSGYLKPGDFLPSANDLADQISLNRNTVNAIYNQLAKESVVVVKKGSGTQVLSSENIDEEKRTLSFARSRIAEAARNRFNLEELPVAYQIFGQIFEAVSESSKRILFVTFRADDFENHREEIRGIRTSVLTQMAWEELKQFDRSQLDQLLQIVDIIVTPYSGLKEIHKLDIPSSKRIIAVGDIPY